MLSQLYLQKLLDFHFFQGRGEWLTQLGTPMYWAVVILGTLVFLLAAAVIFYKIRDARHQGREEILGEVRERANEDRALVVEMYRIRQEMNEQKALADQAAQREAAQLAKAVPIALPLDDQCYSSAPEPRQAMTSFSNNTKHRPGLNPFEPQASVPEPQQQQRRTVVAEVHAASYKPLPPPLPPQPQPQQPKVVAQLQPQQPKIVAATAEQPQPTKVVAPPQPQQPEVAAERKPSTAEQQPQLEVVTASAEQSQQPKVVAATAEQLQQPKIVAATAEQPQQQVVKSPPRFSSAFNGIRARLEHIFEPRPTQQQKVVASKQLKAVTQPQPPLPEVVAEADKQQQPQPPQIAASVQQPPQGAAGVPQQQQKSEVVYASLVFEQPGNAAAASEGATKQPNAKKQPAPPPPTLPKPKMPYAGISKGGTLPRLRKVSPPVEGASSQAASSVALNQAVPTRQAPPPPPQRRSSLRNLSSLRRSKSMPMEANLKLPVKFLNDHDCWDNEAMFVSYV